MSGEIVLGYDASEGAKAALPEATAVARAFGAPLIVAFGYQPDPRGGEVADLARSLKTLGEASPPKASSPSVDSIRR